jgi:D-3-phosphoglycerate dehydrogenase
MQVCRDARGGNALIVLTVDSAVPPGVLEEIIRAIGAVSGRVVDLNGG